MGTDDVRFNQRVYIDIMYLEGTGVTSLRQSNSLLSCPLPE